MEVKVQLNNLRVAPRKSRQVVDLIRGKNVVQAKALLEFTIKRTAEPLLKLLNSATAAAEKNYKLKDSDLYIKKITVDEGPTLKRMNPESRGRGFPIMKRTSHITLVLSQVQKNSEKAKSSGEKNLQEKKVQNSKIKIENDNVKLKNRKHAKSKT